MDSTRETLGKLLLWALAIAGTIMGFFALLQPLAADRLPAKAFATLMKEFLATPENVAELTTALEGKFAPPAPAVVPAAAAALRARRAHQTNPQPQQYQKPHY